MTEQQQPSAVVEETRDAVGKASQPPHATVKNSGNKVSVALSAIAIAIALAAGIGLFNLQKKQVAQQNEASQTLADQIATLHATQEKQKEELANLIRQQSEKLTEEGNQQAVLAKELEAIQQKVAVISSSDAKTWLLAQADFLVKAAGRKLWSDQDVTTAAALLKSADASLAEMNDPSLISARRTITADIASLAAVSQVDYDGIILKVNQLANQIDNLRLADNSDNDSPMDTDSADLSSSISEWRANLQKSWKSFMDDFITIRRRDETAVPLLAPNQDIYLRENIRSQLLIAAQAVPRHQQDTYKQALDNVSTWVRAYYDTEDTATKVFLADIDQLDQQNVAMNVPDTLQSPPVIEKLMQSRVRNLMAQSTVTQDSVPAAPASEPQGE